MSRDYESLTRHERHLYADTVEGTHHRRVTLEILTLDGRPLRSLTNRFLGGQVDTDSSRTPAAVLTCGVFDDDFLLNWQDGAHRRFKARVIDSRFIPTIGDHGEWVEQVVFTGPLWDFERAGAAVSLTAQGTDRLVMGSVREVFKRPRKARATEVQRDLLTEAGAVPSIIIIPKLKATLPERVTVGVEQKDHHPDDKKKPPKLRIFRATHDDTYIAEVQRIATALDRLFYTDTYGRFVQRAHPAGPKTKLTNRHLLAPVDEKRPTDGDQHNVWEIFGANPKGPKKQIHAVVELPDRNLRSAASLRWHGKRHELIETTQNEHLKTHKQAVALGKRKRDRAMAYRVAYEVQCLPTMPWLQQHMVVSIPTSGGRVALRATRWSLGLGPNDGGITLGANKRSGT